MFKESYFQGTEEPTPGKKKYKLDKAIVVQPRFKTPFFKNYDLYDTMNISDTPGKGWHDMSNYKSISEFLEARRKHLKNKYKAEDSWIEDKPKKMKARASLFSKIIKIAIDFPIDDQISSPILGDSGSYGDSVPIGGMYDKYMSEPDFEGKSADKLNIGRDYIGCKNCGFVSDGNDIFDTTYPCPKCKKGGAMITGEEILSPNETSLYGLPDGISPISDLDADKTLGDIKNPYYGTTDMGNGTYDNM